jgi:hypothetical protein
MEGLHVQRFRYDTGGDWYKGSVHIHSTASDGGKTVAEITGMYAAAGFDFLFRTDHWAASDFGPQPAGAKPLWLDGVELDGNDQKGAWFHVVCLGRVTGLTREMGLPAALAEACRQGALLVLAHPHWCGNTFDDALRHSFDGVEIYNHVCQWLNGKGDGRAYWTTMLDRDPRTLGLSVDDAHLRPEHPGWNGGWIVVNAPAATPAALMAAIRAGNFYASCGPEFRQIGAAGRHVRLATSPVAFARLVGPRSEGRRVGSFVGQLWSEAEFDVPPEWPWAYLEIEDAQGRRAWTNALFVPES